MKAVMYGGGNIGRGFIGMLFSQSGYDVTFIDVVDAVVNTLNTEHKYPLRYVSTEGNTDIFVENVSAVNGNDAEEAAKVIAEADVMATAVGVRILKFIVPNIVAGIKLRKAQNGGKLNIIICENLIDADKLVASMIKEQLNEEEIAWFEENIGLVEASIGRMVPVQTDEMKDGEPMRVCVEKYGFLPVDKAAFKGEIPPIKNMVPYEPFSFYIQRKLYVHNMGHATTAYFGDYLGLDYIYQAINDSDVRVIVENAMTESVRGLAKEYSFDLEPLMLHVQDLLMRFTNAALRDTCARVGGDPARKLSAKDRLIGSAKTCLSQGIYPAYIMAGAAGAVYQYIKEDPQQQGLAQGMDAAAKVLAEVSELAADDELAQGILALYELFLNGASVKEIGLKAQAMEAAKLAPVI